jgi:hypothetical protein
MASIGAIPQAPKLSAAQARKKPLAPEEVPGYICKTRLCRFFVENRCKRGKACTFAHGLADVQLKPDLFRTRLCNSVKEGRSCQNPHCTFAHSVEELRGMRLLPNLVAPSPDLKEVRMERDRPTSSKVPMPVRLMASKLGAAASETCSTTTASDELDMDFVSQSSDEASPRIQQTVIPPPGLGEPVYIRLPHYSCIPAAEGLSMSF